MLQAHSPLWHYLWLAPNVLFVFLAVLLWRKGLSRSFPVFCIYLVVVALEQFTLYVLDIAPSVSAETFWRAFWGGLLVEALVKFALIGEVFSLVFGGYRSVANLGKFLARGVGAFLAFGAALAAAHARSEPGVRIIAGAHILEQTTYLVECGLLLFVFVFAAYCGLRWSRAAFGIALGLGFSACVHLAIWAVLTNRGLPTQERSLLDFANLAISHLCILIWLYFLLVPQKVATTSTAPLPENNLDIWNRELERLLQQ
jgi:hypothetical protein